MSKTRRASHQRTTQERAARYLGLTLDRARRLEFTRARTMQWSEEVP
ncbi:MAG: hypothetical protein Q6373_018715 [Candidatus Sigynarchaeota archaeon]